MNKEHKTPCICNTCLSARDKELKRALKAQQDKIIKIIEGMEEKIEDHHEKYYSECPRCCEIIAKNKALKEAVDKIKGL